LGFPRLGRYGTALLFGIMHGNLAAVIPLAFVGWVLAMLYERSGNILAPIVAHVVFNLAPFVLLGLGVEVEV
jgi:membrane protease YdiL (CAAX protease family)